MTDDELERQYYKSLMNPAISNVDEAHTQNKAMPVDEKALLGFAKRTERSDATFCIRRLKRNTALS